MPRPNVELVNRVYEAFGRRDLAALTELFSPSVVIDQSPEVPWGGHYEGLEGATAFYQALLMHRQSDDARQPGTVV